MTDPIPFRKDDAGTHSASSNVEEPTVYSSEEVSEIIRLALENAGTEQRDTVKHADLLSIGREFGLSEADIDAACLRVNASRQIQAHVERASVFFKLHFVAYAVIMAGLFGINALTGLNDLWVLYPLVAWGTVVALHGVLVRVLPKLPSSVISEFLATAAGGGSRPAKSGTPARLNFVMKELYGGMAEGHGIARIEDDTLHIELQIVDTVLGAIKSRVKDIEVPIEDIDDVRLERGFWATKLTIQGDSFHTFAGVPMEKARQIVLSFTSQNRPGA